MEDLNNYKEKLEANLLTLNKFEGLESDLIQQHGNLRAQFSEYREAIEASNLGEKEKREHFGYHDELIKKLHKLILEAKALARKRTEQMTRDELFKLSQERQKALKPQSAEDKIGDEVTKSLKRMLETMKAEVERSSSNISTARETTKNLQGTTENYEKLSGTLDESRGLIRDLWKKNRNDMIYIMGALGVFIATAMWVVLQRTPGVVWLPGKLILRQLGNLIPKSDSAVKFVERVVEMTESALSDNEDVPEMFVDSIGRKEEYGSDDLLKQEPQEPSDEQVSEERSEPESSSEAAMKKIVPEPINEPQVTQEQVKIPKSVDKQEASTPVMAEPVQAEIMSTETPAEQIIPETTEPVQEKVHIKQVVADIKDKTADISPSVEVQAPIVEIKKRTDEAESISSEAAVTVKEHFVKEIAETNKSETDHVKSESAVSQPVIQPVKEDIVTSVKEVIEPTTVVITESTANEVPAITQVPNTEEKSVNGVQEAIKPMADVAAESVLSEVTSNTQTPDIAEKLVATVSDVATTTQVPEIVGTTDSVPTETLAHIAKATENVPIHEITPTAAPTISHKITTESTYYTATESGFEGNQSNYSSEAELFSTSDEKVEL